MTPEDMRDLADELAYEARRCRDQRDETDAQWYERFEDALRAAADQLEAARAEATRYAGWHEQSPEDSWRFERDIRTALGMEQYSGDDDD